MLDLVGFDGIPSECYVLWAFRSSRFKILAPIVSSFTESSRILVCKVGSRGELWLRFKD